MREIRLATPDDYTGIVELATANLEQNLPTELRQQGFLSAAFSQQQIAAMAQDLGIVIAHEPGRVVGFACASRLHPGAGPAIVDTMLGEFDRLSFLGRPLSSWQAFLYGPVCIAADCRGQGLLRKLYQGIQSALCDRFDAGVAFVAASNLRSLHAHVEGLGMHDLGVFTHQGRDYHALAFTTRVPN